MLWLALLIGDRSTSGKVRAVTTEPTSAPIRSDADAAMPSDRFIVDVPRNTEGRR
jgi:hypothetical protein